jgi:hypothetical protein
MKDKGCKTKPTGMLPLGSVTEPESFRERRIAGYTSWVEPNCMIDSSEGEWKLVIKRSRDGSAHVEAYTREELVKLHKTLSVFLENNKEV